MAARRHRTTRLKVSRRARTAISPVHLSLAIGGPRGFPEHQRKPAFDGLPDVFADASPDSFGNLVIRAYYMRAIEIVRDLPGDPASGVRFADPSGNVSTG